jgi:hypothetical protein
MKLLALLFALVLATGASFAPAAHSEPAKAQPTPPPVKKSGPEVWKLSLVGLAVASFLIRKRL